MGQMNFFYGNQSGNPALGTLGVGDLARILDAALVNGFTAQSITSLTRVGTLVTATKVAHTLRTGQRVTIAAASPADYNGTFRITVTDADHFTYTALTTPATSPATGSITCALTGLGWGIAFTATNQRAYRAASGLRHYLMINDNSNTNTCIVRAFTAMTAVTTGTGPFPTVTQSSTNLRWVRPDPTTFANTVPVIGSAYNDSWVVVGDDKRFFVGICMTNAGWRDWYGFGEFQSYKPADAFNSFIFGHCNTDGSDTPSISSQAPNLSTHQITTQGAAAYYGSPICLARHHAQVTQSYCCGLLTGFANSSTWDGGYSGGPAVGTSSPISAGIELSMLDIIENTATSFHYRRGRLPILGPWNPPDFENNDGTVYTNITNFGDILLVRGQYANVTGGIVFPVGDWDTVLS